jgi:hypothetical protein
MGISVVPGSRQADLGNFTVAYRRLETIRNLVCLDSGIRLDLVLKSALLKFSFSQTAKALVQGFPAIHLSAAD